MRKPARLILLALFVGIVVGALGSSFLYAQPSAVTRTPLLQQDLVGLDGKEVNMSIAEIAAGAQSGRHYHPGHEITYVLSGSGTFDMEGQPQTFSEGSRVYVAPKRIHNAKNIGSTPLKVLVVAIHPKGEPAAVPVP